MPPPKTIIGLDGLRAMAALAVFGVHFNQITRFSYYLGPFEVDRFLANGEWGVSLFFSLSGFLLGLPFWRAHLASAPFPEVGGYFFRRCIRIMPAYYCALIALVWIEGLYRAPGAIADIVLHVTFLHNYAEFSIFSINSAFWTLAVEMQFYLLLPFLFLILRRFSTRMTVASFFLVIIAAYLLHYYTISNVKAMIAWPLQPWLLWIRPYGAVVSHSLPAHLPHFLIGVVAGYVFLRVHKAPVSKTPLFGRLCESVFWACGMAVLILMGTGGEAYLQVPYGRYGLPAVTLLLVGMIFCTPFTSYAAKLLSGPPLRQLGRVSYGFYIYHLPCLNGMDRMMAQAGTDAAERWGWLLIFSLAATLSMAVFSYILIEKPLIRYFRKSPR